MPLKSEYAVPEPATPRDGGKEIPQEQVPKPISGGWRAEQVVCGGFHTLVVTGAHSRW